MGKYNFDNYKRLDELEKKMAELLIQNQRIANENAQLRAALAVQPKSQYSNKNRALAPLMDREKYTYLFNYDCDPDTGEIIEANSERLLINFTNLARYILQCMKPVSKCTNGRKNKFYLKYPQLYELDDEQFSIVTDVIKQIIDDLYVAKKTLNGEKITDKEVRK
jgi:hypothetical protein